MAEKILYILGAGASSQALPVAKDNPNVKDWPIPLPRAMSYMAEQIRINPDSFIANDGQKNFILEFADELDWLAKEALEHSTVDTYAKLLFIENRNKYERLKFVLSLYFTVEQIHNKKLDKRYLVWLISILDNKIFPDNIKILSWNYDFQMQLTAERFFKEDINISGSGYVHSPPFIEYYPHVGYDMNVEAKRISLLHLNGIAGYYIAQNAHKHAFLGSERDKRGEYLKHFIDKEDYSRLAFAWENQEEIVQKILDEITKDVSIMVVIGYSFPFFNREMDMKVYSALVQNSKLKKIYFQDPVRDGEFLRSQFGYVKDKVDIKHIKETDAFYIPFEL